MTKLIPPHLRLALNRRIVDGPLGVNYLRRRRTMRPLLADSGTDLFVDGFPRAANSYVFYAIKHANPGAVIRGHTHSAAAIRQSISLGVPTLLLIREPKGCAASFSQFVPGLSPTEALRHYRRFFRSMTRLEEGLQIATFDQVTLDLANVMERLELRTGRELIPYAATESDMAAVRAILDRSNEQYAGGHERTAARPSTKRSSAAEVLRNLDVDGRSLLAECVELYEKLAVRAS